MAQLIVRSIEEEVVLALKRRAAERGRSAEAEHREILRSVLMKPSHGRTLKEHLLAIPDVGADEDFARPRDLGREVEV